MNSRELKPVPSLSLEDLGGAALSSILLLVGQPAVWWPWALRWNLVCPWSAGGLWLVNENCAHLVSFLLPVRSPWRIVDDCGGAFTMGTIGGGIFQAIKGFRNSPVVSG